MLCAPAPVPEPEPLRRFGLSVNRFRFDTASTPNP
jgi:hypothetical protein